LCLFGCQQSDGYFAIKVVHFSTVIWYTFQPVYTNSTYRTSKLNEVLNLITNAGKDAMDLRNKKAPKNQGLSNVAPPSGLEPETL